MECRAFEELISDYLEGTLPGDRAGEFVAHLLGCADCRALLEDVQTARQLCQRVEEVEPSPEFTERLREVVRGALMSCEAFGELVAQYFDGVLTAAEYHLFEAHARACGECSRILEDVAAVVQLLREVEPVVAPEGLEEQVLRATRLAPPEPRLLGLWRRRWRAWRLGWGVAWRPLPIPQWAMAALLCLATLGFLFLNLSGEGAAISGRPRSALARLLDRASHVRTEGERVVEQLERWGVQVSDFLFRPEPGPPEGSERERPGKPRASERNPSP